MKTTLKAIYEQGVLRLKEPLSLNDGAEVDVIVISHEEEDGGGAEGTENRSWDVLMQLLNESAIDTGILPTSPTSTIITSMAFLKKLSNAESTQWCSAQIARGCRGGPPWPPLGQQVSHSGQPMSPSLSGTSAEQH
jgi:predicted DNA-binding antitoxin AbrB/MazE fold protein